MVITVTNGWGRNSEDVGMTFWGREFSNFFWIKCDDDSVLAWCCDEVLLHVHADTLISMFRLVH